MRPEQTTCVQGVHDEPREGFYASSDPINFVFD